MHTGSTPHAYRRLFAYERDSHATVVNSLEGVPLELRDTESYHKAVGLLAHIASAGEVERDIGLRIDKTRERRVRERHHDRFVGGLLGRDARRREAHRGQAGPQCNR